MKKIIISLILIIIFSTYVYAYDGMDTNIVIGATGTIDSSVEMTNEILGVLQVCGTVISVIAIIIIGMRYMFSSLEEKAKMKGVIVYYIIGCVLVFSTTNILAIAYDMIANLEHTWEITRVEPTCETDGSVTAFCTECEKQSIEVLPAFGHTWLEQNRTLPTCTTNGIASYKCSTCGKNKEETIASSLGHTYDNSEWVTVTEASCTETGLEERECSRCGTAGKETRGIASLRADMI